MKQADIAESNHEKRIKRSGNLMSNNLLPSEVLPLYKIFPVLKSKSFVAASSEAIASISPLGLHLTQSTQSRCFQIN